MNFKDMNILITGGAGFLGSHLADSFVSKGANVTLVDIPSADTRNINHLLEKVNFIKCDISSSDEINKLPEEVDIVFHMAAIANQIVCENNYELGFRVNVQGTFNMLNFALKRKVKKFIFPSAASLYGKYPKYVPIDENHPIDPTDSVYLTTKRFGEILCDMFYHKHALPVLYFRLFNSFGERQGGGYLFTTILSQAIKNGDVELWNDKPVRDFTYVKDIVDAFIKGAETKYCGGPINLGSFKESSIGDLAEKIHNALEKNGIKCKINFLNKEVIGPMRLLCDNTKAQRILNWTPKTPLQEGVDNTVRWYVENKDRLA